MTESIEMQLLKECEHCHKKTDYRIQVYPSSQHPYFQLWCPMCTYIMMVSKFFSCSCYGSYPDDLPVERNPLINPEPVKEYNDI